MNTINIPVLALRGMTAFPGETVSFDVEREIPFLRWTTLWRATAVCFW